MKVFGTDLSLFDGPRLLAAYDAFMHNEIGSFADAPLLTISKAVAAANSLDDLFRFGRYPPDQLEVLAHFLARLGVSSVGRHEFTPPHPWVEPTLVFGDLSIPDDLHLQTTLIVTGDLEVQGCYSNVGWTSLACLGDAKMRHLRNEGDLLIETDLTVSGLALFCGNDGVTQIRGNLEAPLAVVDEHEFLLRGAGTPIVLRAPGDSEQIPQSVRELRNLVRPEFFNSAEGTCAIGELWTAASSGAPWKS